MSEPLSEQEPVERLAEEFLARLRRGERPSPSEYCERYPELAAEIRELFPAMALVEQLAPRREELVAAGAASSTGKLPEQLDEYRILREVGRGGMGAVYEAEQISLGRHVAVKVLPLHALMDEQLLKRFQQEARTAARLHHTNIVPVYGVGQSGGIHYYAMQFIHGRSLHEVLNELNRLRRGEATLETWAEAISTLSGVTRRDGGSSADGAYFQSVARVGIQVADALHYAHGQGVLHRDIKPSNLLLDGQGTVWVTDFGLAKQEGENLTQSGDFVGTLRYMAPERFSGDSDARSDVYGLGMTLYEMLALRPAFDAPDRARLIKQITHDEPRRPRQVDRRVPADLETIVLKAIEKEPGRRYCQAGEMVDDLRRFLAGEPILARRSGILERSWKWMRRRPAAAALLSLLVLFAASMTAASWWLNRAYESVSQAEQLAKSRLAQSQGAELATQRQAELAQLEQRKAEELNRFLLEMFVAADPNRALGRDVTVREILDVASERLASELEDQPDVRATLHDAIGWTYRNLGVLDAAEKHIRLALDLRRQLHAEPELATAHSLQHLADLIGTVGFRVGPENSREALEAVRQATAIRERQLGTAHPLTIYSRSRLSHFERTFGSAEAAEAAVEQVVAGLTSESSFPMAALQEHMQRVAELWSSGQREPAVRYIREHVARYQSKVGDPDLMVQGLQGLASLPRNEDAPDISEPLRLAALEIAREVHGDEHPTVATALYLLGATLSRQKKYAEAVAPLTEALAMRLKLLGIDHGETIACRQLLCSVLMDKGDNAAALPHRQELVESCRRQKLAEDDPQTLRAVSNLSETLYRLRRYSECEPLDRDLLRVRLAKHGPDHEEVFRSKRVLGATLNSLKKYDEAEPLLREA